MEELLTSQYGFSIKSIVDGPRGFVGETHIITTTQGEKYFVKKVKRSELVEGIIKGLPVLNELQKLGIENVNYPIPTKDGSLYILEDNSIIVVFSYILGSATFNFNKPKFFKLLASIHTITPQVKTPLRKETFDISYKDKVEAYMDLGLNREPKDQIERETNKGMNKHTEELHNYWMEFVQLAEKCETKQGSFVLTHGDAAGNVVMDLRGNVYIVDWDEIMLAPPERDNWFHLDPIAKITFLPEYRKYVPKYTPDKEFFKYYLYNRFFEDLYGFLEGIYDSSFPKEKRQSYLKGLNNDCFNWLLPLMRLK